MLKASAISAAELQLANPREPGNERRRCRLAAHPLGLGEQCVGFAGERGDHGDDLLAVADVAVISCTTFE